MFVNFPHVASEILEGVVARKLAEAVGVFVSDV